MEISPIFIGGCPRSGTTALVQIFNSNPSVRISSEENLLKLERGLTELLGTRERLAKIYEEKGMRSLSPRETLTRDGILASNFTQASVWPMILEIYKWHHQQQHDAALLLWGDKFPQYYREIEQIISVRGFRYIHITRNPFDVVNSMLRRTEMARQGKDWWRAVTNIDEMIAMWGEAFNAIRKVEAHENVLHLHYEELVFDFNGSVKAINDFINADLSYANLLVDEKSKHYERQYLYPEAVEKLLACEEVGTYAERYFGSASTPNVSESLKAFYASDSPA